MNYDFVTNVPGCWDSILQMMSGNVSLIYYSHIITAVIAGLIGFFVIFKSRELINKILFIFCLTYCFWIIINFVSWLNCNSIYVSAAWSLFALLYSLIPIVSFYFLYVFVYKKDLTLVKKILLLIPTLPAFYLTITGQTIIAFDSSYSYVTESGIITSYYYSLGFLAAIGILIFLLLNIKKVKETGTKQVLLVAVGLEAFLLLFYSLGFLSDYFNNYGIEFYGLIGLPIFMAILAFLIVKFKAFDIKLLAVQALVWGLIILIGAEFFFIQNNTNRILTAITLIGAAWLGLIIIRSVKKEVALREELEIANNNQQALIHFISHQIKGFFTKSKMIFAGILEGDFGESSPALKEMANVGMASDNNAVAMVQDILGASNLKKGTTNYTLKEVDLTEIIKNVAQSFTEEINKRGLKFETALPDKPIMIMADTTQITQVFKNLIDNSVRYTPKGEIKVSLKMSPGNAYEAIFMIQDTGVGLTDKDKSALFTEGGKGEESLKINTNSTGYGLYIVKKIVENHSGRIWAESAGRGHGSTFFVELPVKK